MIQLCRSGPTYLPRLWSSQLLSQYEVFWKDPAIGIRQWPGDLVYPYIQSRRREPPLISLQCEARSATAMSIPSPLPQSYQIRNHRNHTFNGSFLHYDYHPTSANIHLNDSPVQNAPLSFSSSPPRLVNTIPHLESINAQRLKLQEQCDMAIGEVMGRREDRSGIAFVSTRLNGGHCKSIVSKDVQYG